MTPPNLAHTGRANQDQEWSILGEIPMAMAAGTAATARASEGTRWGQLVFGIICMVMIANLQYGWTLFVNPIDQKYHWGRAAIQVAFTIFVVTETWLVPIEGYLIDKFGPKVMVCGSGVLVAIAWVINSMAERTVPALRRRRHRRHRRRRDLRRLGRQRAEVVPGPPRPRRRSDRCRLRRRVDRPRAQRHLPAVLRLGFGPDRPREHDVHRLPRRRHRHLRAVLSGR